MPHGQSPKHKRKPRKKSAAKGTGLPEAAPSKRSTTTSNAKSNTKSAAEVLPVELPGAIRIQKLLAGAGFGSRRDVERFLIEERITVNGRVATVGDRADPSVDVVRVDGERLLREKPSYWIVNKPRGVVTTVRDDEGRRTVMDLLPRKIERLFPVGRLDKETSGLLLMTNDGDTAHVLLHPSLRNEREYKVAVKGHIDDRAIGRIQKGVQLDDGRTSPGRVSGVRFDSDSGNSSFQLILVEGKKRQIRRSLLILGFPVRRLVRIRMGPLRLGRLAVGEARPLRAEERRALFAHVKALRAGDEPPKVPRKKAPTSRGQRTANSRKGIKR